MELREALYLASQALAKVAVKEITHFAKLLAEALRFLPDLHS